MIITGIYYLIELILFIVALVTGIVLYKVKDNKTILEVFLLVSIPIFLELIFLTFIFETPKMRINDNINIEIGTEQKVEMPKTTYHLIDATDNVKMKGKVDYKKKGKYNVVFKIDTLIGVYSKEVTVNVEDTKKPNIELIGDEEYKISYKKQYVEPGYKAIDSYEGDLTAKVKVTNEKIDDKNYNIIYEVEDSSGNKEQKVRKVEIIDDISPTISLNGNRNMVIALNGEYAESGAIAKDEIDGDITDKIQIIGEVDTSKEGTYYITYKVQDNSGNEISNQRIVIVKRSEEILAMENPEQEIGIIFLTFDDGPSANITPKILDILKEKNVKATFFILNYGEEEEKVVKREYEEGHSIGIHGYSHNYDEIYKSEEAYMENITKLREKIKTTTGYAPIITRFPGGSSNTISSFNKGIMTRLSKLVQQNGYKYFDWNVSSEDAVGADKPEELYNNVVNGLSKTKRNFVLMHDFYKNEAILEALPRIIDYGMQNGYYFERITEETPMLTHRIFN